VYIQQYYFYLECTTNQGNVNMIHAEYEMNIKSVIQEKALCQMFLTWRLDIYQLIHI
jgi:hypothetical protein